MPVLSCKASICNVEWASMRYWGWALALRVIALSSSADAAEPPSEQAEAEAAASFASRRFAQAGRQYEELFAKSGRPEHLLAAARAFAAVRTPEARARAEAIAQRYRELPGSDPAAVAQALDAPERVATPPPAEPPRSSP